MCMWLTDVFIKKQKEKSLIFFHQNWVQPNEKTICSVILDSLIAQILHTTYWELKTCIWPFRMCVQWWFRWWQQAGPAFYLHYDFHSIVSGSFCIILYINRTHSLHRCIICFLLLCSATISAGHSNLFWKTQKKRTKFVCSFFSPKWLTKVCSNDGFDCRYAGQLFY